MNYTLDFIKEMPKSDLHLHLDGSLRIPTLIELAKSQKIELPSYTEEGMKELVFKDKYESLNDYLQGFRYTCDVLRDPEAIERTCYELACDNQDEGVLYIEVRFSPQLLMNNLRGPSFFETLNAATKGLERAKKEYNYKHCRENSSTPEFDYGIICCAMRMFEDSFSPYYHHLFKSFDHAKNSLVYKLAAMELVEGAVKIRDLKGLPIVGVDLAGEEKGHPAHNFKEAFDFAHKNFMHKTVHAGEAYGAESIFQAITECHADRIGHGLSLFDPEKIIDPNIKDKKEFIKNLSSYMADKRTLLEVCLSSNLQTNPELLGPKEHKVKEMLEARMAVSICTDNRLVSKTSVCAEYELLLKNFDVGLKRLKDIVAYGFKKSFYPGTYVQKRDYAKRVMQYFDRVAKKHNISE